MSDTRMVAVTGYRGYSVTAAGSVWSHPRNGRPGTWLQPGSRSGYPQVQLYRTDGTVKTIQVHVLVLETFVGPCPAGMEARHLNGDTTDCRLENLQWGTPKENRADQYSHGTSVTTPGVCRNGHERTAATSYIAADGYPVCRICQKESQRRYRARSTR